MWLNKGTSEEASVQQKDAENKTMEYKKKQG